MSKKLKLSKHTGRNVIDVDELRVKMLHDVPKGLGDRALAKALGISESKYFDLKAKNPDFASSVKYYKNVTTAEVLQSFTKIACGFTFDEKVQELKKNKETGKMEMVTTKVVSKYFAPNADAAFKFLKNKLPDDFKDKVETEHSFTPGALENITFVIKGKEK